MNYSTNLAAKVKELGLKKENILYLPIAKQHLNRIKDQSKKIEFRDNSDYYAKKLSKFGKSGEFLEDKPLTHILFQGGYNADSPRLLVYFGGDYLIKEENLTKPKSVEAQFLMQEAKKEGFEVDDEYIGLFLGKIEYEENF